MGLIFYKIEKQNLILTADRHLPQAFVSGLFKNKNHGTIRKIFTENNYDNRL